MHDFTNANPYYISLLHFSGSEETQPCLLPTHLIMVLSDPLSGKGKHHVKTTIPRPRYLMRSNTGSPLLSHFHFEICRKHLSDNFDDSLKGLIYDFKIYLRNLTQTASRIKY